MDTSSVSMKTKIATYKLNTPVLRTSQYIRSYSTIQLSDVIFAILKIYKLHFCGDKFCHLAMLCSITTMYVRTYITYLCILPLKVSFTMVADLKMKP